MAFACRSRFQLALAIIILTGSHAGALAGDSRPMRTATLTDPYLFQRLSAEKNVRAFRLEGFSNSTCDSLIGAGGAMLDCFRKTAQIDVRSREEVKTLIGLLANCPWIRSVSGSIFPAKPTVGIHFSMDSATVDLLISFETMRAVLLSQGQIPLTATIPESLYTRIAQVEYGLRGASARISPVDCPGSDDPPDKSQQYVGNRHYESPELILRDAPKYPEFAREAKIEGKVFMFVLVGTDGHVNDIKVVKPVTGLSEAAVDAVKRWVFKPALCDGEPIQVWIEIPIDFRQ